MRTFNVSTVEAPRGAPEARPWDETVTAMLQARVEQISPGPPLVFCDDVHPLAQAAHHAFYDHHPLILTPDVVWLCLAQGFAHHISLHAQELRHRFVRHEGKLTLIVERPDFVLGQQNPWPEAFAEFGEQVVGHVGKLRDLVAAEFSTTGPTEKAAFDVTLLDTFQPYFEYEMRIGCGIPAITLMGTPDDWKCIRRRAAMLSEFGLEWWTDALLPVLDRVVSTAEGHDERTFWESFFRHESSSTGSDLVLFPYLMSRDNTDERKRLRNKFLVQWEQHLNTAQERKARKEWVSYNNVQGPPIGLLPTGTGSAPLKLKDLRTGTTRMAKMVSGLFGVSFTDASLKPEFGWAVVYPDE